MYGSFLEGKTAASEFCTPRVPAVTPAATIPPKKSRLPKLIAIGFEDSHLDDLDDAQQDS
jgi:hypothetical protein